MQYDEQKLQDLMARMVGESGAVSSTPLIALSDRLGLYKAMTEQGWMTSEQLAGRAGPRYDMFVNGLPRASTAHYQLENEMAMCFVEETNPTFIPGLCDCAEAMFRSLPKLESAFRTGLRVGWHQHRPSLFKGTERFFHPGYAAHLISEWIPALDGVEPYSKHKARASQSSAAVTALQRF